MGSYKYERIASNMNIVLRCAFPQLEVVILTAGAGLSLGIYSES